VIVLENVDFVEHKVMEEMILPMLRLNKAKLICLSTSTETNLFRDQDVLRVDIT
jgi:hypothetical protein